MYIIGKMQRSILVEDVGEVTTDSDFNSWVAKHTITINGDKAEVDQQLLIYTALKRINTTTESMKDGNGYDWVAPVLMLSTSQGFYRDKVVSVTPVTPTVAPTVATKFQVTTYNILTGGTAWSGLSPYEAETTKIPWTVRRNLVVNALKGSQIVMLNEATNDQTNYLIRNLNNMEIGSAKIKLYNNDGSVILFDTTVFEKVDEFSDSLEGNSQVVVAARLRHRSSGQQLVFVSLHLKSGYDNMERRRIREFSAAITKINRKWNDLDRLPVVVAGDLNSDYNRPGSSLVRRHVPTIKTPSLRNAAADVGMQNKPTYYYWHESVFDYILISPQLRVLHMKTEEVGAQAPNAKQGSDHFPVTATLVVGAVSVGAASGGGGESKSNFQEIELRF